MGRQDVRLSWMAHLQGWFLDIAAGPLLSLHRLLDNNLNQETTQQYVRASETGRLVHRGYSNTRPFEEVICTRA